MILDYILICNLMYKKFLFFFYSSSELTPALALRSIIYVLFGSRSS